MIAVGSRVQILKGCKARDLNKGTSWQVTEVRPLGADYSHSVAVRLSRLNGFGPNTITLYARHPNRLADAVLNLNDGNPTHTVQVRAS